MSQTYKAERLKSLLPDYYDDVLDMQYLMQAEQFLIDDLAQVIDEEQRNQFVLTANERGIEVWETLVGLDNIGALDLETRRYNVLTKLLPPKPITIRYLREVVRLLNIEAVLKVDGPKFHVDVEVVTTDPQAVKRLTNLLEGLVPANMTFTAFNQIQDNTSARKHVGAGSVISATHNMKGE